MALNKLEIETVNLYSGFVSLAIKLLQPKGEIVAIIPRSFYNGPYYQQLRNTIVSETAIKHIHIFESRSQPFDEDDVLKENIIIHCQKGEKQEKVTITSSPFADFAMADDGQIIASDTTIRIVDIDSIVKPNDPHKML